MVAVVLRCMSDPCWREDGSDESNQYFSGEMEVSITYACEILNHVLRLRLWWMMGEGESKLGARRIPAHALS